MPPWYSSSRCSSARPSFSSSLQPAIAADAVRQVHDQIALPQLEEAVDRPRLPPPRRAREVVPLKQLGRAHQRDPLRHDAEAGFQMPDDEMQPALGHERRRLEQLAQPLDLRIGLADDEHLVAEAHLVELVADLGDVAAEPLDRLELQVGRLLHRTRRHARRRHRGKLVDLLERRPHRVKRLRPVHPVEIELALFRELVRLDQAGTRSPAADTR